MLFKSSKKLLLSRGVLYKVVNYTPKHRSPGREPGLESSHLPRGRFVPKPRPTLDKRLLWNLYTKQTVLVFIRVHMKVTKIHVRKHGCSFVNKRPR